MKNVARIRWLSRFDMEPLLGSVLTTGMLLSLILMGAGLLVGKVFEKAPMAYQIQAISVPQLIKSDFCRQRSPDFWSRLLVDLGFSILLITPYVRLFVTWLYLVFVKRQFKSAIYTSIALVFLGLILFSDIVAAPLSNGLRRYLFRPQ